MTYRIMCYIACLLHKVMLRRYNNYIEKLLCYRVPKMVDKGYEITNMLPLSISPQTGKVIMQLSKCHHFVNLTVVLHSDNCFRINIRPYYDPLERYDGMRFTTTVTFTCLECGISSNLFLDPLRELNST